MDLSSNYAASKKERQLLKKLIQAFMFLSVFSVNANAGGHPKDIVDTAIAAGSFKTLVAATQAAGLVETLKGEGPFTLFAPTDDAFAALPAGTVEELLKPANKKKLINILTYHGLSGKVMSADIKGKKLEVEMLNKSMANIDATMGVQINGSKVIKADIMATNGVIHVIDKVVTPN